MDDFDKVYEKLKNCFNKNGADNVIYASPVKSPPPPKSYYSHNHRLAIPISGIHSMVISSTDLGHNNIYPKPGDVTFMPMGSWNQPDWLKPVEVITFIFEPDKIIVSYVNNMIETEGKVLNRFSLPKVPRNITTLLNLIELKEPSDIEKLSNLKNRLLINVLIIELIEDLKKREKLGKHNKVSGCHGICLHLDEFYSDNCSRDTIANIFSLTPNYISNLFRKETGYSYSEYVNNLRVKHSCRLLKDTNATLDEISASCGFSSTTYFCRVFRKITGKRPGEIRKE
ncbi:MAG: AraC family transcriptional regulator [Spirochaetaceae bacterium]